MKTATLPPDEARRLACLYDLDVLDTDPEHEFDALTRAASLACGMPISLVSLVDADRQWFKSRVGLPGASETPRDIAFCSHAIAEEGLFEVPDASLDERFADNPLVTGFPSIRFYAGAPVRMRDGSQVGTLCVIDRRPGHLDDTQRQILVALAGAVAAALEGRRALRQEAQALRSLRLSENRFRSLSESSPHGVFYADTDGRIGYTNPHWRAAFGIAAGDDADALWQERLSCRDRVAVLADWRNCVAMGDAFDREFRVTLPNGLERVVHVRFHPVLSDGDWGELIGFVGSSEDITQRKQQEEALRKSRYFLDRTGKLAGVGGWEVDLESGAVHWSDETCQLHGMPAGHRPGMQEALDYYAPEARPVITAAVERCIAGGGGWDLELPLIRADGRAIWVRVMGAAECVDGKAVRLAGAFQDVSERVGERLALLAAKERISRDAEEARRLGEDLAEQHELLRVTLQSIGDAVITTDAGGRVVWMNPVAERLTGWDSAEAKTWPLARVFHILNEQTREVAPNPVAACLASGSTAGLAQHTLLVARHGAEYGIEDSASPIRNERGDILGAVLVFHDVTEQRRLSGEMSYRASHDALTGLVNRAEFEQRLRRLVQQAHGDDSEHALLFIDLDQFKLVNDACGHPAGDALLQQVARLLTETARARDTLARLGGDEFAIILEKCSAEQAKRVAQEICDRMDDFRFQHDERRFRIGASIGLVPVDARWFSTDAIMQAADTSCYAAKEAGRNRVHTWFDTDAAMHTRHGEAQWASRIEQALDEDRFELFHQRIVALNPTANGIHAEVLLRLRDDGGNLVAPGAFLPAAERFHLATRIDRWVLKRAIGWMVDQGDLAQIESLCINLSGQSVSDRAFHAWAIGLLVAAGPEVSNRVCLEITETAAVTNLADAALFIEQLRGVGVRVALDDFGAGASSFGYLKSLPVDYLKIDGQFVRDLISDPLDEAAVRCFADVAKVVGMQTIAEFVDNPAVLQRLREIGIDFAQGYLMHKPEPIGMLPGARLGAGEGRVLQPA